MCLTEHIVANHADSLQLMKQNRAYRQLLYQDFLARIQHKSQLYPVFKHGFLGLAQLDAKQSGKMGSIALIYYFATTFVAVVVS